MTIFNPTKTTYMDQLVISHLREAIAQPGGFDIKPRTEEQSVRQASRRTSQRSSGL